MSDKRNCIGSTKFEIEAHEAPVGDFPAQPSQKDGLGRMCKTHWKQYVTALRAAAVARKDDPLDAGARIAHDLPATSLAEAWDNAQMARTVLAALETAPKRAARKAKLPETIAEVGTPEGQAALEAAAKEAQVARRGGRKASEMAQEADAG